VTHLEEESILKRNKLLLEHVINKRSKVLQGIMRSRELGRVFIENEKGLFE